MLKSFTLKGSLGQHFSAIRQLASTSFVGNANSARLSKKKEKDQHKDNKKKLRKAQAVKNKNKQSPTLHPLYMEISDALRYIRAAEVGNPSNRTTISILTTVIPDKGSKPLSGSVFFPKSLKETKIMAFSTDIEALNAAKIAGATTIGGVELIEQIKEGQLELNTYDMAFATPDIVKDLKVVARQLGPKNLMPNAKKGTVADDLAKLIQKNMGATTFKQKGQHLSMPIGRCDFSDYEIIQNLKAASEAIYGSQPPGTKKPNIIGKTCLSSTIGPSVVIDFRN